MAQNESKMMKPRKETRHERASRIKKLWDEFGPLDMEHVVKRWTSKYNSLKEAQDNNEMILPFGHVANNAFDCALLSNLIKSMTISYDKQLSWLKELIAAYTCADDYKYSSRLKVHCNKALKDACRVGNLQVVNLLLQNGGEFIVPPTMDGILTAADEGYTHYLCWAKQIARDGHEKDYQNNYRKDRIAKFIEDIDPHFVAALKSEDESVMELLLSQEHWRHWELYLYAIVIGILTFEYTDVIKVVFRKAIHSLQTHKSTDNTYAAYNGENIHFGIVVTGCNICCNIRLPV